MAGFRGSKPSFNDRNHPRGESDSPASSRPSRFDSRRESGSGERPPRRFDSVRPERTGGGRFSGGPASGGGRSTFERTDEPRSFPRDEARPRFSPDRRPSFSGDRPRSGHAAGAAGFERGKHDSGFSRPSAPGRFPSRDEGRDRFSSHERPAPRFPAAPTSDDRGSREGGFSRPHTSGRFPSRKEPREAGSTRHRSESWDKPRPYVHKFEKLAPLPSNNRNPERLSSSRTRPDGVSKRPERRPPAEGDSGRLSGFGGRPERERGDRFPAASFRRGGFSDRGHDRPAPYQPRTSYPGSKGRSDGSQVRHENERPAFTRDRAGRTDSTDRNGSRNRSEGRPVPGYRSQERRPDSPGEGRGAPFRSRPSVAVPYGGATPPQSSKPAEDLPSIEAPLMSKPDATGRIRINRYLSQCGLGARRVTEKLVEAGRVVMNGKRVVSLSTTVDPAVDKVEVGGKMLRPAGPPEYYAYHKTRGPIVTVTDPENRETIYDAIKHITGKNLRHLRHVGRLDGDSEGLLLLTNDGDLIHSVTHPRYHVKKIYETTIDRRLIPANRAQMIEPGIESEGILLRAGAIRDMRETEDTFTYEIDLFEGKNRQIRRMFEAVGYKVLALRRTKFAAVNLGDLAPGDVRRLTEKEVGALKSMGFKQ